MPAHRLSLQTWKLGRRTLVTLRSPGEDVGPTFPDVEAVLRAGRPLLCGEVLQRVLGFPLPLHCLMSLGISAFGAGRAGQYPSDYTPVCL